MQPDVQAQDTIILPSGATTGARIELNGTSDAILIYDANNNLIASVAATDGTAVNGQGYITGFGVYDRVSNFFAALQSQNTFLGRITSNVPDINHAAKVFGDNFGGLELSTGVNVPNNLLNGYTIDLTPGAAGAKTGDPNVPFFLVLTDDSVAEVDMGWPGSIVRYFPDGTPYSWQTVGTAPAPNFGTNWLAGNGTFNGSSGYGSSLRYRKDALDNVVMEGLFRANTTAPGVTVFTFPAGYIPKQVGRVMVQAANGGVLSSGYCTVDAAGNFNIRTASGLPLAANATYQVAGSFPLGNV